MKIQAKEEEDLIRFRRAFTGFLKDTVAASEIKSIFVEEGILSIKVTLGPNMCLLEDLVLGEVELFLEERRSWWDRFFNCIRPWEPEDMDSKRVVWLKISKVPCHACDVNLLKSIAGVFGSFVRSDERTNNSVNMSEARILIKSNTMAFINEEIQVLVDGVSFNFFVKEDATVSMISNQVGKGRQKENSELFSSSMEEGTNEEKDEEKGVPAHGS